MNTIIKLSLTALFLSSVFTSKAAINLNLTPVTGTCVSDCGINAFATGTTGDVTYSLINYPSAGQNTTPQISGSFTGLLPGTYTVGVYDNTTAGVPVTKTVTVTTNYVPLLAQNPVASYTSTNYCSYNGTLTISFTGGKSPFRIKVTNTTTGVSLEETDVSLISTTRSYIFDSLASGDYTFEVEDACGQWIQTAPGKYTTVTASANLAGTTFSGIDLSYASNFHVYFTNNGNCSNFSIELYYYYIKIYLNGTTSTLDLSTYSQVKIRAEYPAGSGIFSSWVNIYTWPYFSFTNFDPTKNKFRLQVLHPCTSDTITSGEYTIATKPVFRHYVNATTTTTTGDYCPQNTTKYDKVEFSLDQSSYSNSIPIYSIDGCGPYTVVLKDASNATFGTLTTPASGNGSTSVQFTNVSPGTYSATITNSTGFSQTLTGITVQSPTTTSQNLTPSFYTHTSSPIYGYNYIFCDYNTTAISVYMSTYVSTVPVTYSIAAASGTQAITRPPITITHTSYSYITLWDDIPWGTYNITADMGCKTVTKSITLTQPVTGFTINSLTVDNSTVCGSNDLIADAYYHKNGTSVSSTSIYYRYYMLIVDGPAKIGTRSYGRSSSSSDSYKARISNLPGGTYKVLFYPYHIPVSTQIVNGKTVSNYPTTMRSCYEARTITIPDYVRPVVDIPLSGGITCTSGTTNLTVSVLAGNKPPFLYRYKVKGAPDATYTPAGFQTGNVFSNLPNGNYTVQIKDDCGSITTQDVRIFDGTEQFVGIIGEVSPGVVCETREIILSVLSIGPVQSYLWEFRQNSSSPWTALSSTTGTYVIPSATQADKGQYRVTISNGLCSLASAITIVDVLPPPGTPSITSPTSVICLGGSTLLTAHTTLTSPNYQWYKDGSPVGTSSSTYSATAAGSYTVVVTPSLGCPSDPSAPYVVTEQIPAHPDASDLSANEVCNGGHPVIHLATSQTGVTYSVYAALSGGTSVGSAVGTGSAMDITLSTTPSSSVTYYVGATLNSCNSASRTAVTVPIASIPTAPAVNSVPAMCSGTTFSINVPSPNANYYYEVYTASTGGSPIGQSTKGSGTISGLTAPASSTTYYVSAVLSAGCESNRTSVPITITPRATDANITANGTTICSGETASLSATASGVTSPAFKWYADQTSTTELYASVLYTTPILTATTKYYVAVSGSNYCENVTNTRKEVTVTVNSFAAASDITAKDTAICYGTTAELKVRSNVPSPTFFWYKSQTAPTSFHTGATYTTSALTADTVVYVSISGTGYCENATDARKAITVTINPVCAKDDYVTASCDAMPVTIDVLTNDIKSPVCTSPVVTIVSKPAHVAADVVSNKIVYTGTQSGVDTITYRVACGASYSEAKMYVTVDAFGSAFVDDIWYFGMNTAGAAPTHKSAGIRFVNDGSGNYVAQDASGESNVYSGENALVISSPYCNGENIFYMSHNKIYNSLHTELGEFEGHTSIADGLAACYMGSNKYMFFSASDEYNNQTSSPAGLYAYIVDMTGNGGMGELTSTKITIETPNINMSESVELVASAGTTNKYWLIYRYGGNLRVRSVDVGDVNPVSSTYVDYALTAGNTWSYTLKTSPQYDKVAIVGFAGKAEIFDIDSSTGVLDNHRTITESGELLGLEFSPDGNQLYFAAWNSNELYQYDIATLSKKGEVAYNLGGVTMFGGGLKLGPDGNIYIVRHGTNKIGRISNPNSTSALSSRYNSDGLTLSVYYGSLQLPAGLTKPAIVPCSMNESPIANPDETTMCVSTTSRTTAVNVLKNDADIDLNTVYLTSAEFVHPADIALADIAVNSADSTVALTVKNDVTISAGYVFEIIYHIKDNGLPASQCSTGTLKITTSSPPSYPDIRLRVCPDAGNVNLAKYIDTTGSVSAIQWSGAISSAGIVSTSSLASARALTFTYTITSKCVANQKRKVYLEVIKNGKVRNLRDTIVICNEYADAVQINQLFGIESGDGDSWSYHAVKPLGGTESIDDYVTKSTAPSIHAGARVMNGKAIYEDGSIPYNSYHGLNNVKIVKITYKSDDDTCLDGREFTKVIVLTGS